MSIQVKVFCNQRFILHPNQIYQSSEFGSPFTAPSTLAQRNKKLRRSVSSCISNPGDKHRIVAYTIYYIYYNIYVYFIYYSIILISTYSHYKYLK